MESRGRRRLGYTPITERPSTSNPRSSRVQIVIPMSGFGERFRRAGYALPKPLIPVDGKAIIHHVVDLFPGERDILFICNRDHLAEPGFAMAETLLAACPTARILAIEPHKLGPVHAVRQAFAAGDADPAYALDPERPVVVNYCDFTCYWDWQHFQRFVAESGCDGAIPCYTGFHPHMLGSVNYAYVREAGLWGSAIQEKQPFTSTPNAEYASSGTYYFASAALLRHYADELVARNLTLGGEYYASLLYVPMFEDGRRVAVYPLQHFMQWGTPEDLAEYRYWSDTFRALAAAPSPTASQGGAVMVPMAGLGTRFADEGYAPPKPMIPVSGVPMAVRASRDLPTAPARRFVLRRDAPGCEEIGARLLLEARPGGEPVVTLTVLDAPTDGQARTCLAGLDGLDLDAPLTIGACDNGALYDADAFARALDGADVLVWIARGYPGAARNPKAYGWVDAYDHGESAAIRGVSVKQPLADPARDPVVIGTFTFRRARDFVAAAERMIARDARVNGELYVDTCINDAVALGLRCRTFEVERYLCWGTPNDLRTFEYWQSCFHKWPGHPYRLEDDVRVPADAVAELAARFAATVPPLPVTPPVPTP
jgi:NDP-sugar pyrophosphorylase family protein